MDVWQIIRCYSTNHSVTCDFISHIITTTCSRISGAKATFVPFFHLSSLSSINGSHLWRQLQNIWPIPLLLLKTRLVSTVYSTQVIGITVTPVPDFPQQKAIDRENSNGQRNYAFLPNSDRYSVSRAMTFPQYYIYADEYASNVHVHWHVRNKQGSGLGEEYLPLLVRKKLNRIYDLYVRYWTPTTETRQTQ